MAKIRLPRRRDDVLRRSRLVDFLHQNIDKRLILVCAGAGYGKTTLLVDFAHDVDLPVCWYSMDPSDADPRNFFEYLILSIRQRFPNFGHRTQAILGSVEDVSREISPIVASLTNEIQSDITDYFLVILDDFHWADESESISSALDLLIYYLPDNCHILVSSRALPRLTFSRLAAQRQAVGLGTSDLRFTGEEVTRLLKENYRLALAGRNLEQLLEASEGWITDIILSTHSLWKGPAGSLARAKGSGSALYDYLAGEAYSQQPPELQRFLLCSSVLKQMTPEQCDRLFAKGTAAASLSRLVRANLFITELEGPNECYRYHNLFQEFLQSKLKAEDPELYVLLHRRAAKMAEEEGDWDSAFAHFQAAGDLEGAADLIQRVGDEMTRSGRRQTLHRWLESMPAEVIDARPKLSLHRGRTYLWLGETDAGLAQLDLASQGYRAVGDAEGAASALTVKGTGLRLKGRLREAIEACTEALRILGDLESPVTAQAHQEIGVCLASLGEMRHAEAELRRALQIHESLGDRTGIATVCQSLGILAVRMGDLAQSMASHRRALALWKELRNAAPTAGVLNCIAAVYHRTGEYQQALPVLEEALASARQAGYMRSEAFALATMGDVKRDSGNLHAALESYELALDIAQRVDDAELVNYLLDALGNTHRLLGDYSTAARLVRQALRQAEEGQSPLEAAYCSISVGVLAEEQGDLPHAEQLLRTAAERLSGFEAPRELARARFHLARTLLARQDEEGAALELEACLELCRQLGYDQFMVAEGQRAGELLSWAISKGIGGRRLELVAERLRRAQQPSSPATRPRLRVESSEPKQIQIFSFGQARVLVDSRLVTSSDWAVERTKELFFYLLEQPHSPRKEQIVDALWPELEMGKSNSQFHSTVYRLRRAIFPQCLAYQDGRYALSLGEACWYDVEEFTRLLDEADLPTIDQSRRIESYERALSLYKGPYLEEFYSDWVVPRREELEQRYLQALSRLAKLKAGKGELEQAVELLRSAVARDPYLEDAHYGLIHYAALMGDRTRALHHYRRYVQLLSNELGARPSANVAALADCIARGQSIPSP